MPQALPRPTISDDLIRSFGRIKARRLSDDQMYYMNVEYPRVAIDLSSFSLNNLFPKAQGFCLEIGFGGGEHLVGYAQANPDTGCIGCEPFLNGVASCVKQLTKEQTPNVRVFNGDARLLLEKLPDASLDKVFILFPDPWPKARHHRKRIINHTMLDILAAKLKPGGILEVATDHADYKEWIAQHLDARLDFTETDVTRGQRHLPPADWIRTRYQEKAEAQGRAATFFVFERVR